MNKTLKCATPSSVALLLVGAGATTVDQGTEVGVTIIQLITIKNFKKEKKTPI